MKHFRSFFKCLPIVFFLLLTNTASASSVSDRLSEMDSVDISLLTCGPGNEVYTLYGHTAIRVNNRARQADVVANYGIFSLEKSFFVPLFVFGITDYTMGLSTFESFCAAYAHEGRWVKEQRLNLGAADKLAIVSALETNYLPENRVYRYNYFYDNCTTRARNIIADNISGRIDYRHAADSVVTYRSAIHAYNGNHPWARLGNDLLLGVKADVPITYEEQQFLPENLMKDFDNAVIVGNDGSERQLVESTEWLVMPSEQTHAGGFPLKPFDAVMILSLVIFIATIIESRRKKSYWLLDAVLLTADGIAGLILLAMVFSQHPTVQLNFQILLFCPVNLFLICPIVKNLKNGQCHKWLKVWCALLVVYLIGGQLQKYPEGEIMLAMVLMVRYMLKIIRFRK